MAPTYAHLDRQLVGVDRLQAIIETAFFTACLKNTVPISTILVGPPGSGKSKLILQYQNPSIHQTNDITSQGLAELVEDDKAGQIRHVVIPDFNIVVSHKASTTNLTVASLLTLMSEGVLRIDDGRRKKELLHAPLGICTAMTREIYEEHAIRFRKLGIGRRFVPVFFSYSPKTREQVQDSIRDGGTTLCQLEPHPIVLPPVAAWPIDVPVVESAAERLRNLSRDMADALAFYPQWEQVKNEKSRSVSWQIRPFRGSPPIEFTPHMVLRAMAQAHALRDGRNLVSSTDVEFCLDFVQFTNYSLPVLL